MASIISFTFREAVVDVVYKGKNLRQNILLPVHFNSQNLLLFPTSLIKCCFLQLSRLSYTQGLESHATVQEHPS